jgi:SAM-dependent methyltransferase
MQLLDAGCGPGSITIGLATAVAPGQTVGVDSSGEAVESARTLAAERGCSSALFEVADIHALPYDDGSFDAAFIHAVLQHLPDPLGALREVHRVLKPGGIIGVADADYDASVMYPQDPLIARQAEIMAEMHRLRSGGDPRIGKRLRALLHEAGFVRTEALAAANVEGTDDRAKITGAWWASYVSAPEFIAQATALGVSDEHELRAIAAAQRAWAEHPGAIWATMFCQAIGWKP